MFSTSPCQHQLQGIISCSQVLWLLARMFLARWARAGKQTLAGSKSPSGKEFHHLKFQHPLVVFPPLVLPASQVLVKMAMSWCSWLMWSAHSDRDLFTSYGIFVRRLRCWKDVNNVSFNQMFVFFETSLGSKISWRLWWDFPADFHAWFAWSWWWAANASRLKGAGRLSHTLKGLHFKKSWKSLEETIHILGPVKLQSSFLALTWNDGINDIKWYYWWKKSCTSWDV